MTVISTPTATVSDSTQQAGYGNQNYGFNGYGFSDPQNGDMFNAIHHISSQSAAEQAVLLSQLSMLNGQIVERGFDMLVAVEKVGAANQLATEKIGAATALAIEKTAAAAALTAANNHAEILREMLKCCCETRELIRAEADVTRALIRDNELASVRQELADAKLAALLAKKP